MREHTLLVVDDDPLILEAIKMALPESWRMLAARAPVPLPERGLNAALVDMHLSGRPNVAEGVEVIRALARRHPRLEIVAMSGDLDRELMERCLRAGATRFLAKPLNYAEVRLTLDKIEALLGLQNVAHRAGDADARWVGDSAASRRVLRQIAQLRGEFGPILIEGESGTGKEVCAQLIHAQHPVGPLISVNVASVPENLFESEFFGHVKGAFTGADQPKMGLIEAAGGGDLFLDEIEALTLPLQAKLLRFLESGEVRRVGARETSVVKTRVLAASNRDLERMVRAGEFREDLYWRLAGQRVALPALRDRPADIPALVHHFLARDPARRRDVEPAAMDALVAYAWPGNVRELKRVCERLVLIAPLPILRREDVLEVLRPAASVTTTAATVDLHRGLADLVDAFEKHVIGRALEGPGEVDDVARLLKISRSSLYKKIKDHDLNLGARRGG